MWHVHVGTPINKKTYSITPLAKFKVAIGQLACQLPLFCKDSQFDANLKRNQKPAEACMPRCCILSELVALSTCQIAEGDAYFGYVLELPKTPRL